MIDWEYADLFKQTSVKKTYIIDYPGGRITNEDLILESVEIAEAISNEKTLKFGGCISSSFKFRTKDVAADLIGKNLTVSMIIKDDYAHPLPIGVYVARTETVSSDGLSKTVSCYDALYDILNADYSVWYNYIFTQVESLTISQFRAIFFEYIGIAQKPTTLILDDYVIHKQNVINEKITGNTILTALCEINACFGRIGRDGRFEYVLLKNPSDKLLPRHDLYPSQNLYPRKSYDGKYDKNVYISCKTENFIIEKINYVSLVNEDGVQVGGHGILADRENKYSISNNIFVYSLDSERMDEVATQIYAIISKIFYQPFASNAIGNPCMEVGDAVRINLADGRVVNSYIFKRTMKGIHALYDNIGSNGTELIEQKNTGVASDVRKLKDATSQHQKEISRIEAEYVTTVYLQANYITANEIRATYVETTYLTANYLTAQQIDTQYLKAETAQLTYATIGSLNAATARISALEADSITTQNLRAQIGNLESISVQGLWFRGNHIVTHDVETAGGYTVKVLGYERGS